MSLSFQMTYKAFQMMYISEQVDKILCDDIQFIYISLCTCIYKFFTFSLYWIAFFVPAFHGAVFGLDRYCCCSCCYFLQQSQWSGHKI